MTDEEKRIDSNTEAPEASENSEPEAAETEAVEKGCEELLSEKEEEVKQLQDRVLRLAAEMENTRKRLEREKSEGICYANESLIRELLSVVDNLERALQHAEDGADLEGLLEGIRMTQKGFLDVLSKFGCEPFDSVGSPFDPNFHEAVMQQESADHPENTVLEELQKGYKLNNRLIRPAVVVVSKAPSGESGPSDEGDQ